MTPLSLSRAPRNPWRHLDRLAGRADARRSGAAQAIARRGRDADDHAERAAGRQPARLSRAVSGLDLLELFAFVHPARFAVPTPRGIAHALGLDEPARRRGRRGLPARGGRGAAGDARRATGPSAKAPGPRRRRSPGCAGPGRRPIAERLQRPERDERWLFSRLPEWEEKGGRAAAAADPRRPRRHRRPARAAGRRGRRGAPGPARLCRRRRRGVRAAHGARTSPTCCSPRPAPGSARPWAISPRPRSGPSRPDGAVWVSTYTKALQRQLDREGARLFPDAAERRQQDRDPQGPRELSLPAQPRGCAAGRLRRPRRDPRPAGRALGRLHARTATWSAATCRAG